MALLVGVTSAGCSLMFTKGPEPEVHPAPPCTTSIDSPVWDTILAVLSVGLLGVGVAWVVDANSPGPPCVDNCGKALQGGAGFIAVLVGTTMGILFTTSAVVGYQRTAACRAFVEQKAPPVSVSQREARGPVADAPRAYPASALLFEQRLRKASEALPPGPVFTGR